MRDYNFDIPAGLRGLVKDQEPAHRAVIGPAIFLNHGGGPHRLFAHRDYVGLSEFVRDEVNEYVNFDEVTGVILVTAHWQENKLSISSGNKLDLYTEYCGIPHWREILIMLDIVNHQPPSGHAVLAKRIHDELKNIGWDSKLHPKKSWDHGAFVPMALINPDADIPIIQVSLMSHQDPETHYQLGQVLHKFRKEGVAIIGSGMSYDNMSEFMYSRSIGQDVNEEFDVFLNKACTSWDAKRRHDLISWQMQPGADKAHPPRPAEYILPLIVTAGAGGRHPGEIISNWDMTGKFRLNGFIWKDE